MQRQERIENGAGSRMDRAHEKVDKAGDSIKSGARNIKNNVKRKITGFAPVKAGIKLAEKVKGNEKVQKFAKAAKAVGEKSIEMIKSKELLPLTGYVHGGCSPIGMKKFFKTVIDESAGNFDTIIFSAGKIGYQVEVNLSELEKVIRFDVADISID